MKTKHTNAEKQTAKALRFDSLEISEGFANRCERDDLDTTATILRKLMESSITIETLNNLGDLFHKIADTAVDSGDHHAETCEALCEMVSQNLSAKYYKSIGRI